MPSFDNSESSQTVEISNLGSFFVWLFLGLIAVVLGVLKVAASDSSDPMSDAGSGKLMAAIGCALALYSLALVPLSHRFSDAIERCHVLWTKRTAWEEVDSVTIVVLDNVKNPYITDERHRAVGAVFMPIEVFVLVCRKGTSDLRLKCSHEDALAIRDLGERRGVRGSPRG